MMELKGKKVAVLGLTDDGLAMVNALSQAGARVAGFGTGTPGHVKAVEQRFQKISGQLTWKGIPEEALTSFDLIVDTPGGGNFIPSRDFAKKQGVKVLSDLDLALKFMPAPLIAVTGTNGKSTTVALIRDMLIQQGFKVVAVGGDFSSWAERLTDKKAYDYYVLEVNSRRLEISDSLHAHIAVLLNLYPAHGDRHEGGVPAYIEAKAKVFAHQTSKDFLIHEESAGNLRELLRIKSPPSTRVPFSLDSPLSSQGVYRSEKDLIYRGPSGEEESYSLAKAKSRTPAYLMDLMSAIAAAKLCRVTPPNIQAVIDNFSGLPSRMEKIRTVGDVVFIDDSRATNIGATAWALASSSRPIIWIAGGGLVDGARLQDLPKEIKGRVKLIVLFGSDRKTLVRTLSDVAPIIEVDRLKEAVALAHQKADPKDWVIFSPFCPPDLRTQKPGRSRGSEFKKLVKDLPEAPRQIRARSQFVKI